MNRTPSISIAILVSLAAVACSGPPGASIGDGSPSPVVASVEPASPSVSPSASVAVAPSDVPSPSAAPPQPSASDSASYAVTYGWAVPGNRVTIPHAVHAPIAPPPALPLPALVAVAVGDHPTANPAYQRISFTFRGAFPEYNIQYVRSLTAEGSGAVIPLAGNGVLRIGFVSAQAHDNDGASTVKTSPKNPIGFHNLKSYAFAGDFEGHVTYGLGLQVLPDSDQVLQIRSGELTRSDGAGSLLYVVAIDIRTA